MIKFAEECNAFEELLPSPYGARIYAQYATYGPQPFADFWHCGSNGALSRVDGVMTLCPPSDFDPEETGAFIRFAGCSSLCCPSDACLSMGFSPAKTSFIVEYEGQYAERYGENPADLKEVYGLLQTCGFVMGDYPAFLQDVGLRVRREKAEVLTFAQKDCLLGTASALFIGKNAVLLGAVGTRPDARGKGIASRLVCTLAEKYKRQGKRVFLFCRNDDLVHFYAKCGFTVAGKWCEANPCDANE